MTEVDASPARAVRGIAWAGLTQALSKGASVAATLVLARVLVPEDFGLFAVGILVINYLDRIKDVGVGASLVYRRGDWARMAGTGLPLSLLSAVVLAGAAYLCAPLAADFFHDPRAESLVKVLSAVILVSGLGVVPESKMHRELDFRRRLVPETAAAVVKGAVSVLLALAEYGVWSLVWGQLAGTVVQSSLYWVLCGWRPRFAWNGDDAKALLRYGIPSAGVAVFSVVVENLDYLVIGNRMSASELGFYVVAYRMPELLLLGICLVASQVLFPFFSRLQDDLPELSRVYLAAVRVLAAVTVPTGLLLAVLAEEVVLTLFSAKWEPAVPVLALLALFTLVESLSFHAGDIYKATGRPGILNTMAVVTLAVLTPALWVGASHGIVGVAWAMLLASLFLTALKLVVARKILALSAADLVRAFMPSFVAGAVMAATVLLVRTLLIELPPQARLALLLLVAAASYAAALYVLIPREVRAAVQQLRSHLRPGQPAVSENEPR